MKLSKKQIDTIILYTPAELKEKPVTGWTGCELGYYQPNNANWAYHAQYIDYNGAPVLVVTRFGHIV
ncbi:MAG: hypothetical protein IKW20_05845 [Bacteroidales bacterium]|nr:hypothetical protein [Bacteroidales bacterium]